MVMEADEMKMFKSLRIENLQGTKLGNLILAALIVVASLAIMAPR
jgi:hypothetical protein